MGDPRSLEGDIGDISTGEVVRQYPNAVDRDAAQLLRDILAELRVMNVILYEGLNVSVVDLENLRRDISSDLNL